METIRPPFFRTLNETRVGLATDVVEDGIVVAKDVFEVLLLVINHLVGAQAPNVFNVIRAGAWAHHARAAEEIGKTVGQFLDSISTLNA
jgi:hypothetical protein